MAQNETENTRVIEDYKAQIEELKEERNLAVSWAVFYENCIRYKEGNHEIDRLKLIASKEIPRLLSEAWSQELVHRFVSEPDN